MVDTETLAVHGGTPLRKVPWPSRGLIGDEEKHAAVAVFDEAIRTGNAPGYGGSQEENYCREFADSLGGGFADAVNSGSTALYVALRALGIEPFSEVAVACVTDPGGMMPIPLLNCIPVPVDTAPGSFNVGPEQVEEAITPLTRAIVVVHMLGEPADMPGILAVAERHGIPVIEDCAQAHGATFNGQAVGTFGDIGVFSTMFGKHHCTGGQGGVVFTQNETLMPMIRRSADRGKPFGLPAGSTNQLASLNFNLNDLACAIGREQLKKLPGIVERIRSVVERVRQGLNGTTSCRIPEAIPGADPSYWKLRVAFPADAMSFDKATFCAALRAEGLLFVERYEPHCMPHRQAWFRERRAFGTSGLPWSSTEYRGDRNRTYPCPNAMAAMDSYFLLLCHEAWTQQDVDDAVAIIRKVELHYRR